MNNDDGVSWEIQAINTAARQWKKGDWWHNNAGQGHTPLQIRSRNGLQVLFVITLPPYHKKHFGKRAAARWVPSLPSQLKGKLWWSWTVLARITAMHNSMNNTKLESSCPQNTDNDDPSNSLFFLTRSSLFSGSSSVQDPCTKLPLVFTARYTELVTSSSHEQVTGEGSSN